MKKIITALLLIYSNFSFSQDLSSIKIGGQVWTQKNFDKTTFRTGEIIKEVSSKEDWLKAGYREEPAWCYYNFDPKNAHLGKFYNYYAVSDSQNIAPMGWRVPSIQDYYSLVNYLDPLCTKEYFASKGSLAGGNLKLKDSLWIGTNCPQINSNFNALPAGGYSPSINYPEYDWDKKGEKAMFWCITNWNSLLDYVEFEHVEKFKRNILSGEFKDKAIVIRLRNDDCELDLDDDPKLNGYSLRLIKEN
ncbi:MAG: FISUMP domain-containing protein [Arcticibacter sp.]